MRMLIIIIGPLISLGGLVIPDVDLRRTVVLIVLARAVSNLLTTLAIRLED